MITDKTIDRVRHDLIMAETAVKLGVKVPPERIGHLKKRLADLTKEAVDTHFESMAILADFDRRSKPNPKSVLAFPNGESAFRCPACGRLSRGGRICCDDERGMFL